MNEKNSALEIAVLRELRLAVENNSKSLKLRKKIIELGGGDPFVSFLKLYLQFNELIDPEKSIQGTFYLSNLATEDDIKKAVTFASKGTTPVSITLAKLVLEISPRNQWFDKTSLSNPSLSRTRMGKYLSVLFQLGVFKRREFSGKDQYYFGDLSEKHDYTKNVKTSPHDKLRKVLLKLSRLEEGGTRQSITKFLLDNGSPYYSTIASILVKEGFVIKYLGNRGICWNINKLKIPHVNFCIALIKKAKVKCEGNSSISKNLKLSKSTTTKTVSKNKNLLEFLYSVSSSTNLTKGEREVLVSKFIKATGIKSNFEELCKEKQLKETKPV
jgi:hypothetical protein